MTKATKTTDPIQWPPDTTGHFTAYERRLFAIALKPASGCPVGWSAAERRAFAKRSSKAKRRWA